MFHEEILTMFSSGIINESGFSVREASPVKVVVEAGATVVLVPGATVVLVPEASVVLVITVLVAAAVATPVQVDGRSSIVIQQVLEVLSDSLHCK